MPHANPERYMLALRKTPALVKSLLKDVSQEQARSMTDGPDGWSVVETMCHMRDFEEVSMKRVRAMLEQDNPPLPKLDNDALAASRDYKNRNLKEEVSAHLKSRQDLVTLLVPLSEAQWQRTGTHGSYGQMTLLELAVFIVWHDLNHIEQIARTLGLSEAVV